VGRVESHFDPFGDNVIVDAIEVHGMHLLELLGDKAQVEARFGLFGDSGNLDKVRGLHQTYRRLRNHF
jgi:hypothetical protein